MFIDHRQEVLRKMDELKENLKTIDYKLQFYDTACNIGVPGEKMKEGSDHG